MTTSFTYFALISIFIIGKHISITYASIYNKNINEHKVCIN